MLELFPYLASARNNTERWERTLRLLDKDRFLVPDCYHDQEVCHDVFHICDILTTPQAIGGYWRAEAIGRLVYMHFFPQARHRGNKDPEAF